MIKTIRILIACFDEDNKWMSPKLININNDDGFKYLLNKGLDFDELMQLLEDMRMINYHLDLRRRYSK